LVQLELHHLRLDNVKQVPSLLRLVAAPAVQHRAQSLTLLLTSIDSVAITIGAAAAAAAGLARVSWLLLLWWRHAAVAAVTASAVWLHSTILVRLLHL
jgi:hypothetical protein